jgi:hypothetical protein
LECADPGHRCSQWAWGEADPPKSYEEVCVEWAVCAVGSVAGNLTRCQWLPDSTFTVRRHYATTLRRALGIDGMPSQFPGVLSSC